MANTYTQLYLQFVFAVRGRENLIKESFREELEKIMCGVINRHECKTYAIYCNPDHTHIFVGMHPNISPSKLIGEVKSASSKWINDKFIFCKIFNWQKGFGAFTYSKSHIDRVVKYVLNQPIHHRKKTFKDEYLLILQKFGVDYDPKYVFEWYE
jgi:REP element-mobilizing transposase RayT